MGPSGRFLPAYQGLFAPSHFRGSFAVALAGRSMTWAGARYWTAAAEPMKASDALSEIETGIVTGVYVCKRPLGDTPQPRFILSRLDRELWPII